MFPFSSHTNLVMACHLTGIYDVNRGQTLPDDDYNMLKEWAASLTELHISGIVFHNNLSEDTCTAHENQYIKFIKVQHDATYNPNVYRYFVYRDFLQENANQINSCFITDVTDVVAVSDPFADLLFVNDTNRLFCGDEPKCLDNDWMHDHSAHLRSRIADYADYEEANRTAPLLNCGIIGGHIEVMKPFVDKLSHIHQTYNRDNQTTYTGDMGAFNYLARTQYNNRLCHGAPVNTVFKAFETGRKDCWFRHK